MSNPPLLPTLADHRMMVEQNLLPRNYNIQDFSIIILLWHRNYHINLLQQSSLLALQVEITLLLLLNKFYDVLVFSVGIVQGFMVPKRSFSFATLPHLYVSRDDGGRVGFDFYSRSIKLYSYYWNGRFHFL